MAKNYKYDSRMNRYIKYPTRSVLNRQAIIESESLTIEIDSEKYLDLSNRPLEEVFTNTRKTWMKKTQNGNWFVYRGGFVIRHDKILGRFCGYVDKELKVLRFIDICSVEDELYFVNEWDSPWIMVDNFTVVYEESFFDISVNPYSHACVGGTLSFIRELTEDNIGLSVKNFAKIIKHYNEVSEARDNPIKPSHKRFFENCQVYLYRLSEREYNSVTQYFSASILSTKTETELHYI